MSTNFRSAGIGAEQPKEQSQVYHTIGCLEDAIAELSRLCSDVEERLQSVMSDPAPPESPEELKDPKPLVPLASTLSGLYRRVSVLNDRLERMLDRLEL